MSEQLTKECLIEKVFPLDYLDWCKANKHIKSLKETERADWIREYYDSLSESDRTQVKGYDILIALGVL